MALPQQKYREIVFQLLYGQDLAFPQDENLQSLISKELKISKRAVKEAQLRVNSIIQNLEEIDSLIGETSQSYNFKRIPSAERNILRLAIYEIIFDDQVPPKVAIAEAIRLARKFSSPESATYVNALVDALYKKQLGEESDLSLVDQSAEALLEKESLNQEIVEQAKNEE